MKKISVLVWMCLVLFGFVFGCCNTGDNLNSLKNRKGITECLPLEVQSLLVS